MLSLALLGAALVGGLLLIPFGLPGLWVMLGAALLHWVLVPLGGIGLWTTAGAGALVVAAEVLEFTISARYTRKYGGSRRASWGAVVGGLVGAVVGIPVPAKQGQNYAGRIGVLMQYLNGASSRVSSSVRRPRMRL